MSAVLKATDLAAGHGARALFSGLDLVVGPGDVVGLVGANGAGKSTLLRLLAGELDPEQGTVSISPPDATVGHLPQEPQRRPDETVAAFLARRTGVAAGPAGDGRDRRRAERRRARAPTTPTPPRWTAGSRLGGADLDERAAETAATVGLGVELDTPMTALSGGQAARAGLAALLLSRYDVLLLDEPTNDLDLDGLERLERFVTGLRAAGGDRQPRPGVPGPHRDPGGRAGPGPAAGRGVRRRVRGLPGRARGGPPARPGGLRGVRRPGQPGSRTGPGRSATGWPSGCATPAARPPTTTRSAASSGPRPARSRRPRPARPSA